MYLFIDVSLEKGFALALFGKRGGSGSFFRKRFFLLNTDRLIASLKKILKETGVGLAEFEGVAVRRGGTFTSQRTGVVLANALGFVYNLPVLGVAAEPRPGHDFSRDFQALGGFKPLMPIYEREPNITKSKNKSL
jgi:tRNA A37 threonylcarbamoyladenosine modification protein TsaB